MSLWIYQAQFGIILIEIKIKDVKLMHEIGVVRAMLHTVDEYCEQNNVDEVGEIVIDIGELSLVIPKYVEEIYPVVIKDTKYENTKLIINEIPGLAECDECDEIFNVIENKGYCPKCGSFDKQVLSGDKFLIREIHVKE